MQSAGRGGWGGGRRGGLFTDHPCAWGRGWGQEASGLEAPGDVTLDLSQDGGTAEWPWGSGRQWAWRESHSTQLTLYVTGERSLVCSPSHLV